MIKKFDFKKLNDISDNNISHSCKVVSKTNTEDNDLNTLLKYSDEM